MIDEAALKLADPEEDTAESQLVNAHLGVPQLDLDRRVDVLGVQGSWNGKRNSLQNEGVDDRFVDLIRQLVVCSVRMRLTFSFRSRLVWVSSTLSGFFSLNKNHYTKTVCQN